MATAVAHEAHVQPWRAEAMQAARAGRCADDPARRGGGVLLARRGAQQHGERAAAGGREREAARRHRIDAGAARLADHRGDGAAAQRLLHRPQHLALAHGGDGDEPLGREPRLVEAGPIGRAALGERHVLGEPEDVFLHLSPRAGRGDVTRVSAARVRGPLRDSEPGGEAPSPQPSPRARGEGVRLAFAGTLLLRPAASARNPWRRRSRPRALPRFRAVRRRRGHRRARHRSSGCRGSRHALRSRLRKTLRACGSPGAARPNHLDPVLEGKSVAGCGALIANPSRPMPAVMALFMICSIDSPTRFRRQERHSAATAKALWHASCYSSDASRDRMAGRPR